MTRIANHARAYRSQLRAEQAEETRTRILDATGRVMARGITRLSVPAVAREAGVSVPTVYRHFATKSDLVAAIYPHAVQRAAVTQPAPPRSIDELRDTARAYFEHVESYDDIARAAMASPASDEVRQQTMPYRLGVFRRVADSIEPKLAEADRERITRLLVVLTASSSMRMWRDNLGSSVDEAVNDLIWLVNAAVAAASKRRTRR